MVDQLQQSIDFWSNPLSLYDLDLSRRQCEIEQEIVEQQKLLDTAKQYENDNTPLKNALEAEITRLSHWEDYLEKNRKNLTGLSDASCLSYMMELGYQAMGRFFDHTVKLKQDNLDVFSPEFLEKKITTYYNSVKDILASIDNDFALGYAGDVELSKLMQNFKKNTLAAKALYTQVLLYCDDFLQERDNLNKTFAAFSRIGLNFNLKTLAAGMLELDQAATALSQRIALENRAIGKVLPKIQEDLKKANQDLQALNAELAKCQKSKTDAEMKMNVLQEEWVSIQQELCSLRNSMAKKGLWPEMAHTATHTRSNDYHRPRPI